MYLSLYIYNYIHIRMYVCICVCVYIYIYIHMLATQFNITAYDLIQHSMMTHVTYNIACVRTR